MPDRGTCACTARRRPRSTRSTSSRRPRARGGARHAGRRARVGWRHGGPDGGGGAGRSGRGWAHDRGHPRGAAGRRDRRPRGRRARGHPRHAHPQGRAGPSRRRLRRPPRRLRDARGAPRAAHRRLLGFHDKPIVLVDVAGFWQPLLELFEHLYRERFARPESRGAYTVATTSSRCSRPSTRPSGRRCSRPSGSERKLRDDAQALRKRVTRVRTARRGGSHAPGHQRHEADGERRRSMPVADTMVMSSSRSASALGHLEHEARLAREPTRGPRPRG